MAIESLKLINFQIHKNLKIEFDTHVTTIVGPNDHGKSAILRALYWLSFNKPSGEEFRKWDSKNTLVKLKVDGHTIIRRRGSDNSYSLDSSVYKAFGKDVPASITNLLNANPNNFQMQDTPAFWISCSASDVARNLNKIVNLEIIDESLNYITTENRRARTVIEVSDQRLRQAREKKRELGWVKDFVAAVNRLEGKEKQIEEIKEKQENLSRIIQDFDYYNKISTNATPLLQKGKKLIDLGERIQSKQQSATKLKRLINDFEVVRDRSNQIEQALNEAKSKLSEIKICPICNQKIKS